MSEHHFCLSDTQLARFKPLLPNKLRGIPRVDDQRVISGIIHVLLNGLLWRDAPERYGPPKTLYNRFIRWSKAGVFDRIFAVLASGSDATHLKAHRTAASLLKKGIFPTVSDARKGELDSKLHTVCDRISRPLFVLLSKEQVSDYRGAASVLSAPPNAKALIAAKGYTSNWLHQALENLDIKPCIPSRTERRNPIQHDQKLYKQRNVTERMFGRLKDGRRITTRYGQCAHTFMSAICIAATVTFWLCSRTDQDNQKSHRRKHQVPAGPRHWTQ